MNDNREKKIKNQNAKKLKGVSIIAVFSKMPFYLKPY